jgi:DNA-binding response OmpR family regulator
VLVVDRDEAARANIVEGLRDRYDVITASDGFGALSAILSANPDAVVLDLFLGDVSGYDVLRALSRSANAPPVLAVSDRLARAADRIRALVLGAADVLPKTSARFEVRLKVDSLLANPPRRRDLQLDVDAAELLTLAASKQRRVSEAEFRTRIERAQRFGERFGVTSTMIAIEMKDPDDLDALVRACEGTLRAEDALLPIDEHRALLLAVASGTERAPQILKRLRQQGGFDAPLSWGCRVLTADIAQADWGKYFEGIDRQ